jgi:hypothetical protein
MQDRAFPFQSTRVAGFGFRYLFPVRCCRCGAEKDFESHKIMPDVVIHKKFMQWGWLLGRNRSHDICPRCLGIARENRLASKFKVTVNSEPVPAPIEVVQQAKDKRESLEKAVHDGLLRRKMYKELTDEVREMRSLMAELLSVIKMVSAKKKTTTRKKAAPTKATKPATKPKAKKEGNGIRKRVRSSDEGAGIAGS